MRRNIPRHGQTRIVRRFLYLPKTLSLVNTTHSYGEEDRQQRWLEYSCISQTYFKQKGTTGWKDMFWSNDDDYAKFLLKNIK